MVGGSIIRSLHSGSFAADSRRILRGMRLSGNVVRYALGGGVSVCSTP
jgi:hypothetical protein